MAIPSFSGTFRCGFFIFLVFTSWQCRHKEPVAVQPPPAEEEFYAGHSAPDNHPDEITSRADHAEKIQEIADAFFGTEELGPAKQRKGHYGIDISRWQKQVNWTEFVRDSVPHRIGFVFIKATQGHGMVDAAFHANWQEAQKHPVKVGAYHFYRYKDDPVAQANNYIKTVPLSKGHILPVVDVEMDCPTCTAPEIPTTVMIANLKKYMETIETHYKVKPIIYTYHAFYHQYLKGQFPDHLFWFALYKSSPPEELTAFASGKSKGDPKVVCWQFTDSGKVPGIGGEVDMSFLPGKFEGEILMR